MRRVLFIVLGLIAIAALLAVVLKRRPPTIDDLLRDPPGAESSGPF